MSSSCSFPNVTCRKSGSGGKTLWRSAPAHRHRERFPAQSPDPDLRRSDFASGFGVRTACPAGAGNDHTRKDRLNDRPPPFQHRPGRPNCCHRGRRDRRARNARGITGSEWRLSQAPCPAIGRGRVLSRLKILIGHLELPKQSAAADYTVDSSEESLIGVCGNVCVWDLRSRCSTDRLCAVALVILLFSEFSDGSPTIFIQ